MDSKEESEEIPREFYYIDSTISAPCKLHETVSDRLLFLIVILSAAGESTSLIFIPDHSTISSAS